MSRLSSGFYAVALLASLSISLGCNSIASTMLYRDESNVAWLRERHLHGVPITLKVPTHLRVSVTETHYLEVVEVGGISRVQRVELPVAIRGVDHDFIYTSKIFTVDFKRPAAGTMQMSADFNAEQYFSKIQHQVVDETIEDVSKLVTAIAPKGLFGALSAAGAEVDAKIKPVVSVVATEVFSIDDPEFELRLAAFLDCHLNKAHDAWVLPDGVSPPRRLNLIDEHTPQAIGPGTQLCPEGFCGDVYPTSPEAVSVPFADQEY